MLSFISFLQGAQTGPAPTTSNTGSFVSTIGMMVVLVAIFYFFLIRPQNKKQKETEKMLAALKKGDKVVTIGGIHGVVASVKEKTIVLRVDDDVKIEFSRSAISGLENPPPPAKKDGKEKPGDKKSEDKKSEGKAEESKDDKKEGAEN